MARIFIDGFESGAVDLWTLVSGSANIVTASTYGLDGSYAIQAQSLNLSKTLTAADYYYGAIKVNVASSSGDGYIDLKFRNTTTILGTIRLFYNHEVRAYRGDNSTLLATGTTVFTSSTVYNIEFYYKPATDGTGAVGVKVNGMLEINYSGQSSNNALQIDNLLIVTGNTTNYLDDVIIDSSDYPGLTYIQSIVPTGAGTTTGYTPSTGANYTCIDEKPAVDTDYITTNTADIVDTYATGNLTGTIGAIKCVQVQARADYEGSSAVTKLDVVVHTASDATDHPSADITLSTILRSYSSMFEQNPAITDAWTEATVNAVEIGVKAKAT